jgi:hypothetical protein
MGSIYSVEEREGKGALEGKKKKAAWHPGQKYGIVRRAGYGLVSGDRRLGGLF